MTEEVHVTHTDKIQVRIACWAGSQYWLILQQDMGISGKRCYLVILFHCGMPTSSLGSPTFVVMCLIYILAFLSLRSASLAWLLSGAGLSA